MSGIALQRAAIVGLLVVLLAGCGPGQSPGGTGPEGPSAGPTTAGTESLAPSESLSVSPTPSATESAAPSESSSAAVCVPGDQDADVYHPARLVVITACLRVTGTIYSSKAEPDGDLHIRLTVDPPYANLINPVNGSGQLGKLVIEPVCEHKVTQADAVATCAADADPINVSGLTVGAHVWMEGRYVTDMQHGGWAELHPLYRWGLLP